MSGKGVNECAATQGGLKTYDGGNRRLVPGLECRLITTDVKYVVLNEEVLVGIS